MKNFLPAVAALLLLCSCASAPEKKTEGDKNTPWYDQVEVINYQAGMQEIAESRRREKEASAPVPPDYSQSRRYRWFTRQGIEKLHLHTDGTYALGEESALKGTWREVNNVLRLEPVVGTSLIFQSKDHGQSYNGNETPATRLLAEPSNLTDP